MKIYLDYIFLENLVVNIVIISELIKFTKSKVSTKREVLIIIIDTILSCIFAIYSNFSSYILHFFVSIVILFFLFNPKNIYELIKKFCYYYLLYFIYIGIVISFSILFKINLENIINKLCIYGISAIFFHFLCKDLWKMWKINITDRDLFYTLCINGKRISAFVDTGNSVKDPATSLDVIFLKECLKEEIITKDMKPTITYINVSTVNGSELKIGYIIKNITVYKEKREIALIDKIILSFSLDNSNTPEKYSAILGYDTYLENLKGGNIMIKEEIKLVYLKILRWLGLGDSFLYYIAGNDKLPAPLSEEEELKLLKRLMDKDKEAKNILVEKNLRLVVYIAKKFESSGINIEDLISIGTIGLMKAINSYDLSKNIKLATYASRCIENEILMYLRKNNKIKTEISIDEPINVDSEGNDLSLGDILGTDNDSIYKSIEDEENKKILKNAIQGLSKREKTIMQLRYGFDGKDELTQKEVADRLGISQSYISRLEKKVINNLRNDFTA